MATPFTMLDTITREEIMPEVIAAFFNSSVLLKALNKRTKTINGGDVIEQPLEYASNPDAGAWLGGFSTLPLSQPDVVTKAQFKWAYYQVPIAYAETDAIKNMGKSQVVDLAEIVAANALRSLRDTLGKDIYKDGSNNARGAKTIDGLSAALTYNANGAAGSYGGISRASSSGTQSSYTNNAWWNANVASANQGSRDFWVGNFNIDNAATTLSFAKLAQLYTALMVADDAPDMFVMAPALFAKLWQLVQLAERIPGGAETGEAGFRYINFNGVPCVPDANIDAADKVYALNTKYILWRPSSQSNFKNSGIRNPSRMRIAVSYIFWDGNMVVTNPRTQGLFTGFTT